MLGKEEIFRAVCSSFKLNQRVHPWLKTSGMPTLMLSLYQVALTEKKKEKIQYGL